MVDKVIKDWYFPSNKAQSVLGIRQIVTLIEDNIIYFWFKARQSVHVYNTIVTKISKNEPFHLEKLPALNDFLNTIEDGLFNDIGILFEEIKKFSIFILTFSSESRDPTESGEQVKETSLLHEYRRHFIDIINDILNLIRNPGEYASVLFQAKRRDTKWMVIYEGYVKSHDLGEIEKFYTGLQLPITTMLRAKWYQIITIALFTRINIKDFILGIAFRYYKSHPRNKVPVKVNQAIPLEAEQTESSVTENPKDGPFDLKRVLETFPSWLPKDVTKEDVNEIIDKIDTKKEKATLNIIEDIYKALVDVKGEDGESTVNEELTNQILNNLKVNWPSFGFYNAYLEFLTINEKEDLVLDYLHRFGYFLERNFKPLLQFLNSIVNPDNDWEKETLGYLIKMLRQNDNRILRDLLIVRNAIAHASFTIVLKNLDFNQSVVTFQDFYGKRVFYWKDFVEFAEKTYEVMLGWIRYIKDLLTEHDLIKNEQRLIDAPSIEYAYFWELILESWNVNLKVVIQ